MSKTRTITLTGRPPVKINEDNWPFIASVVDSEHDSQYECQANRKSKWFVGVRQHEDGRAIVYATYGYETQLQHESDLYVKRGVLLEEGATTQQIVSAIEEVCADMGSAEHHGDDAERWSRLVHECIADLPAEELA